MGSVGLNLDPCAYKTNALWIQFSFNSEVPDVYHRQANGPWLMKVTVDILMLNPGSSFKGLSSRTFVILASPNS